VATSRIGVLLRGTEWPFVLGLSAGAAVVGGVAVALTALPPPMVVTAFALLAAASAGVLDEPASTVVDVTPTSRRRQVAARVPALVPPLGVGAALVMALRLRNEAAAAGVLTLMLVGNVLAGFATSCIGRRREGTPSAWAVPGVALVLALLPLLPPVVQHLQVFPAGPAARGQLPAGALWSVAIALSLVAVVVTTQPVPLRSPVPATTWRRRPP
jgi:hypothetical protein